MNKLEALQEVELPDGTCSNCHGHGCGDCGYEGAAMANSEDELPNYALLEWVFEVSEEIEFYGEDEVRYPYRTVFALVPGALDDREPLAEYAARCREAREASTDRDRLWLLLGDAFNLIDGAACPVDSPEEWKAHVRAQMVEALRCKPWGEAGRKRSDA